MLWLLLHLLPRIRASPNMRPLLAPRPYATEAYHAANKLSSTDIEKVLQDDHVLQNIALNIRRRKISDSTVNSLFEGAIEMALGELGAQAYSFLLQTWRLVFELQSQSENTFLQKQLYSSHEKLVHTMMNRGDYTAFQDLLMSHQSRLRHLHESLDNRSSFPSWAYKVMDVAQFQVDDGILTHNQESVESFLRSARFSVAQKHQLNAMLLQKSLLYGPASPKLIQRFLRYIIMIDGNSLLSFTGHHLVYKTALRLLLSRSKGAGDNPEHLDNLQKVVTEVVPEQSYFRLLSDAMMAASSAMPELTIQAFQFKQLRGMLTSEDLTALMKAYVHQEKFDRAIENHAAFPLLQDDEQIVLLLQVNERTKNWKLLQQQFEDMYGRKDLPRTIHYSVVIGALASVGSQKEVERLYVQMQKRHLQPTYPIFRGIIRACINNNDYTLALVYYDDFMGRVQNGEIDPKYIPRIESEVLLIKLFQCNVKVAMQAIEDLFEKQKQSNTIYLDSEMIVQIIKFFSVTYSKKEFLRVWQFAEEAELLSEHVYYYGITFYTKLGEFQESNELAKEAHRHSLVPFHSNLIYKGQIRNYRVWVRQTSDKYYQSVLKERARALVARLDEQIESRSLSPRNLDKLLVELIKHSLIVKPWEQESGVERDADRYFRHCKELGLLSEAAYLPFLRECAAKEASFQDNSRILDLYREMVASKIDISAESYKYLIAALLKIDQQNQNGFKNSFILLESIFEIYGFTLGAKNFMASSESIRPKKLSDVDLLLNAVPLLQILSQFSVATSGNIDLIVQFLNQFRDQVADKMSFEFRLSILKEMSKVYLSYGNLNVTTSLVSNALGELNDIVDQFHTSRPDPDMPDLQFVEKLPKLLQLDYREVYGVQLQVLEKKFKLQPMDVKEYERILHDCVLRNIRLSGDKFNEIFLEILHDPEHVQSVPEPTLEAMLNCCERFLVSGNWAEAMVFKKISYIYRVFLRLLSQTQSVASIYSNYKIFNNFYGIQSEAALQEVLRGLKHVRNPAASLQRELGLYNSMHVERAWTIGRFFNNVAEFFTPERLIRTRNFIRPGVAARLVLHIEARSHGVSTLAFGLYDRYPETIEYLLFFNLELFRVVRFRKEIEKILGISVVAGEGRHSRRKTATEALSHLGRELRGRR